MMQLTNDVPNILFRNNRWLTQVLGSASRVVTFACIGHRWGFLCAI